MGAVFRRQWLVNVHVHIYLPAKATRVGGLKAAAPVVIRPEGGAGTQGTPTCWGQMHRP